MALSRTRLLLACSGLFALLAVEVGAQGTSADYSRAEGLRAEYENAALDMAGAPAAIGRTHRFWYRKSVKGGEECIVVDADTLQKQPAFDHEKLARSLSSATGKSYTAWKLPLSTVSFNDEGTAFLVRIDNASYR